MPKKKFFRRKDKDEKKKRRNRRTRNQKKNKLSPTEIEARKKAQRAAKFNKKYSKDKII
ncbi:MAG: hypothetical protein GF329_04815 [Candidatus Lokiarchaeota archaeon]|nr:hypothetical protein [Candidatus Lokiarchaeota archaeon]